VTQYLRDNSDVDSQSVCVDVSDVADDASRPPTDAGIPQRHASTPQTRQSYPVAELPAMTTVFLASRTADNLMRCQQHPQLRAMYKQHITAVTWCTGKQRHTCDSCIIKQLEVLGQCIPPPRHVLPVSRYRHGSVSVIRIATKIICSLAHCQPSVKFRANPFASFCAKLLTDKQTNNDENITSMAEVMPTREHPASLCVPTLLTAYNLTSSVCECVSQFCTW